MLLAERGLGKSPRTVHTPYCALGKGLGSFSQEVKLALPVKHWAKDAKDLPWRMPGCFPSDDWAEAADGFRT